DFSGSKEAGKSIWIAEGKPTATTLQIDHLTRACHLPDGGMKRDVALAALRKHLTGERNALIGLDFPFSIPQSLIGSIGWRAWVESLSGFCGDADAFRAWCRSRTGGKEPKRVADKAAATPWAAFNLKLYRQTFHGLTSVISPLVFDGQGVAVPMMPLENGKTALIEICPASVLKAWNGPTGNAGYKGKGNEKRSKRIKILHRLKKQGLDIPAGQKAAALDDEGGDAVDALIAAYATWRVALNPDRLAPRLGTLDAIEGRIYFED
ncbi:MAG: DUF429 domain-containing protein, partial [Pseudomonadota bacterium]